MRPTTRKLADVAVGIAAGLVVFAAVPSVLVLLVGDPLPSHWTAALLSLHGLFELLAIVAWCAWATCAWSLLRAVVARVRTRDTSRAPRLVDQLAVRIAAAILAIAPAGIASAHGSAGAAVRRVPAATAPPRGHVAPVANGDGAAQAAPARNEPSPRDVPSASASRRHGADPPDPSGGEPAPLPELAALGVGSLVAALVARRARSTRRLRSLTRPEGSPTPDPRPDEVALSTLLAPFERSVLLERVEAGLSLLTVAALAGSEPLPAVQWLRASNDGVDVHFAAEPPPPSLPWVATGSATWRMAASPVPAAVRAPAGAEPWCPVVVPVGDDEEATWLLPIPAGGCLAVVGPMAEQLTYAMQVATNRWSWQEMLVVTADVDTAAKAAGASGAVSSRHRADPAGGPHVLFVGDPRALTDRVRARCAVLTTEPSIDAAATVLVDRRAATVHPYGVALRPHLLDDAWAGTIARVAPPASAASERDDDIGRSHGPSAEPRAARRAGSPHPPAPLRHHAGPSATARVPPARTPPAPAPEPGTVDVRLLVAVPRIEGLGSEIPPKRARRATELIAYLALHSPEPVTGDRLRTRVLGSADSDAASKTLFNTVYAARRALGSSPEGAPLLPPATRTGHYRISALVTVDARRAAASIEAGLAAPDAAESLALIERGLALVEGEPLGGVLTGYGWWRAEGHERQLADLAVDGACALCRGAIACGQIDRARWAIARARRTEAYSETLTRASMEVAAASGDVARLHTEWLDCRRQVDELDPGGMPSAATERLYVQLRARLGANVPAPEAVSARI